jgi:hypothetical protein
MRSVHTNSEVLAKQGIDEKLTRGIGCARFLLLRRPNLNRATRMYRKTATALVLATLVACNSADIASTDPSQNRPETAKLDIVIDWAVLDRLGQSSMSPTATPPSTDRGGLMSGAAVSQSSEPEINRIGVRVEFPDEDAVFTQSVDRRTAENSGLITMVLPPTNNAKIYVLAVHEKDPQIPNDVERAKAMAYQDVGRLTPGKAFKLTTQSLNFVEPTWTFASPVNGTLDGTTLTANVTSTETTRASIGIVVADPFGDVPTRNGGTRRFLELNGTGGILGAQDGNRTMTVSANRSGKAAGQTTLVEGFFPYVNGALFNLGDKGRFGVHPTGKIVVTWQ